MHHCHDHCCSALTPPHTLPHYCAHTTTHLAPTLRMHTTMHNIIKFHCSRFHFMNHCYWTSLCIGSCFIFARFNYRCIIILHTISKIIFVLCVQYTILFPCCNCNIMGHGKLAMFFVPFDSLPKYCL
jgi:hypothetical protein